MRYLTLSTGWVIRRPAWWRRWRVMRRVVLIPSSPGVTGGTAEATEVAFSAWRRDNAEAYRQRMELFDLYRVGEER